MKASVTRAVIAAALAGTAGAGMATAAQAQSADATASVTLVYPAITVNNTRGLSFGTITTGNVNSNVTVAPDGSTSTTGGVTLGGEPSAAQFSIAGASTDTVTVTLPVTIDINGGSGSDSMTVDNFTLSGPGATQSGSGQYTVNSGSRSSTLFVTVGGRLHIKAASTAGDYSGTFTIAVNNN